MHGATLSLGKDKLAQTPLHTHAGEKADLGGGFIFAKASRDTLLSQYSPAMATLYPESSPHSSPTAHHKLPAATFPKRFQHRLHTLVSSQSKQGLSASSSGDPWSPAAPIPGLRVQDFFMLKAWVVGAKFKMANKKRAASGPWEPSRSWRLTKPVHLVRRELGSAGIAGNNSNLCSYVSRFFFSNHQIIPREKKKRKEIEKAI